MITLPNGDKWIIDGRELRNLEYEDAVKGNVPETKIGDFIRELLDPESACLPRKLTERSGGVYWDVQDPYDGVLGTLAVRYVKNLFFRAYEMPSGDIHVIYEGADTGGYDVKTKAHTFPSMNMFVRAVTFSTP